MIPFAGGRRGRVLGVTRADRDSMGVFGGEGGNATG